MRESTVEQPARNPRRSTAIRGKSVRSIVSFKPIHLKPDTRFINHGAYFDVRPDYAASGGLHKISALRSFGK